MIISIKPGQKLFINGAIILARKRIEIELINHANFILSQYILQREDIKTELDMLYFIIQLMIIQNEDIKKIINLYNSQISKCKKDLTFEIFQSIEDLISNAQYYDALKLLRKEIFNDNGHK